MLSAQIRVSKTCFGVSAFLNDFRSVKNSHVFSRNLEEGSFEVATVVGGSGNPEVIRFEWNPVLSARNSYGLRNQALALRTVQESAPGHDRLRLPFSSPISFFFFHFLANYFGVPCF